MASTQAPAMIGIDPNQLGGSNDRFFANFTNPVAARIQVTSGVVGNATATATLPAVASQTNMVTACEVDYLGATAAGAITGYITGCIGGLRPVDVPVPAGVTTVAAPIIIQFSPPLQATGANTAVSLVIPALGAGNTSCEAKLVGYLNFPGAM